MIQALINTLELVAPAVGVAYGLCSKETNDEGAERVVQYVGGGQARRVEGNSWSYWRITSPIKQRRVDDYSGCEGSTGYSIGLKYVVCGEHEICGAEELNIVANRMRRSTKAIETALNAIMVIPGTFSVEVDRYKATQEFGGGLVPLSIGISYIDLSIEIIGDNCIDDCGPIVAAGVCLGVDIVDTDGTFIIHIRDGGTYEVEPPIICSGVDILDGEGNIIAHVDDGDTYTATEVNNILPYADRAAALADGATIPTTAQMVVINDTHRLYHGDGVLSVRDLVNDPQVMYLPVREDGKLYVTVEGVEYTLQLNT